MYVCGRVTCEGCMCVGGVGGSYPVKGVCVWEVVTLR